MNDQIHFDSTDTALLRQLMKEHGDSQFPFFGTNEDGETIEISIIHDGIVLRTFQRNGWIRKNYFDKDGYLEGETFER